MDWYRTIEKPCEAELKVKGSRFLAYAAPVADRAEAEATAEQLRKRWFDATHVCYAYRLGFGGETVTRAVDDGEPAGSAGKPILAVIEGMDLRQIFVAVVRWFGGTKLGIGGLVRAYSGAATSALEKGEIVTRFIEANVSITCSYAHLSAVMATVERYHAKVADAQYADNVRLIVALRRSLAQEFLSALVEAAAGRVQADVVAL